MVVEMDRDPAVYPESNIVEVSILLPPQVQAFTRYCQWPRASSHQNPVLDGFTIRRTGDVLTKIRLILFLDHMPEQFKVAPELGHIILRPTLP